MHEALYTADFGVETTNEILTEIKKAYGSDKELQGRQAAEIGDNDAERAELIERAGQMTEIRGRLDEAASDYEHATRLFEQSGQPPTLDARPCRSANKSADYPGGRFPSPTAPKCSAKRRFCRPASGNRYLRTGRFRLPPSQAQRGSECYC